MTLLLEQKQDGSLKENTADNIEEYRYIVVQEELDELGVFTQCIFKLASTNCILYTFFA